jgi:UDP-N-acetylmuramate dehydrogenase
MLFSQHYQGTVLHNQIMGCKFSQDQDYHYINVGGGESWHQLVMNCCEQGIGGFENLALIPGTVGAAPIQNIGAYGVELADLCVGLDAYSLSDGTKYYFNNNQCQFGYRDSMLKRSREYFISQVYFKLAKRWQPQLKYGELKAWAQTQSEAITPLDVAQQVIAVRQAKLPDPELLPNAGSFFKNPVVSNVVAQQVLSQYPDCPSYPSGDDIKLAAGWLIDRLGLKGFNIGDAAVHRDQALVLINQGRATSVELIQLAAYVRQQVQSKFGVILEPEVNFIAATGYSTLDHQLKSIDSQNL